MAGKKLGSNEGELLLLETKVVVIREAHTNGERKGHIFGRRAVSTGGFEGCQQHILVGE